MRHVWLELEELVERDDAAALVTVTRTEGSAYQREGTKMLFRASGEGLGTISGGCLEVDIFERCRAVLDTGTARIVTYTPESMIDTVFGFGSGCLGTIDLLIEPTAGWQSGPARQLLAEICKRVRGGERCGVLTLLREDGSLSSPLRRELIDARPGTTGGGIPLVPRAILDGAFAAVSTADRRPSKNLRALAGGRSYEALIDVFVPAQRVILFGAGEDARPLASIAAQAGMEVAVVDWRPELLRAERFPEGAALSCLRPEDFPGDVSLAGKPAIVLMSHGYEADRTVLGLLLKSAQTPGYLGILGPRSRTARLLADLEADGQEASIVRTPAGLDLGADTPEEIALSIVAEILAVRKHRSGVPLGMSAPDREQSDEGPTKGLTAASPRHSQRR
jgi:xanthine/CO dehydrogenase XdhC/CoxF family maturation factor